MKYLGAPQSGSQANTTASHNRAGQYYRNRRTPVAPTRTPRQGIIRTQFGASSRLYQTLSAGDQAAWTSFAASYPVRDSLGQTVVLTGHQMFVRVYTALQNAGAGLTTAIPSNLIIPAVTAPTVYADDDGNVLLMFQGGLAGDFMLGGLSKLQSLGVTFCKTFTQFGVGAGNAPVLDLSDQFTAIWGFPSVGRQIFGRLTYVNSSGLTANGIIVRAPVLAGGVTNAPALAPSVAGVSPGTWSGSGSADAYIFKRAASSLPWEYSSAEPIVSGVFSAATPSAAIEYCARVYDFVGWSDRSNIEAGS